MLYQVYNLRMMPVGVVNADNDEKALAAAKKQFPGASVQRILSEQEERQKAYDDADELWRAMNPDYR